MTSTLAEIEEVRRLPSPMVTPQALAWHDGTLWLGSRDERRLCGIDARTWTVFEEAPAPGIPWAAVATPDGVYVTSGEDADDDRYLRRYIPGRGFDEAYRIAVPELTGSYLSFDGQLLYLSQWYKHRVLALDGSGAILRTIPVGAEICGQVFVGTSLYMLLGTEQDGESWHLARLAIDATVPQIEELARVPFACRSLTFDGTLFWTNHRAANETVAFSVPGLATSTV